MWMFFLDNNDLKQCRSKVLTLVRKGRLADVLRYHWRSKHFLDVQATLPETLDVGRGRLGSGFGDWKMFWNYIRKPSAKTLFPKKNHSWSAKTIDSPFPEPIQLDATLWKLTRTNGNHLNWSIWTSCQVTTHQIYPNLPARTNPKSYHEFRFRHSSELKPFVNCKLFLLSHAGLVHAALSVA